jgi:predicted dehydrogenase
MLEAPVFTILGSGFGMYGYLPALIECGIKVALPERYRSIVGGRSELTQYVPEVTWCAGTDEALARSNGAVVALRPADQSDWIARLAKMPEIRDLIIEKPIAPKPQLAVQLLDELDRARKRYRVGYTFRFMPWAERLRTILAEGPEELSLDWCFVAHHYRANIENWKRFDVSGGGALRFYGIHVIALFAELGYDDVASSVVSGPSDAETASWEAIFTAKNLTPFAVRVDSRASRTCFKMTAASCGGIVDQLDPFAAVGQATVNARDPRVDVLTGLCRSFAEADADHAQRHRNVVALWARIEQKSRRVCA